MWNNMIVINCFNSLQLIFVINIIIISVITLSLECEKEHLKILICIVSKVKLYGKICLNAKGINCNK